MDQPARYEPILIDQTPRQTWGIRDATTGTRVWTDQTFTSPAEAAVYIEWRTGTIDSRTYRAFRWLLAETPR